MDHIAQIAGKLADHQLDAMLLASQAGERYAVGFHGEGLVLVTREGAHYSTDSRYIEAARQEVQGAQVELVTRERGHLALAAGANGSKPHAVPGDTVIQPGMFVTMDFGCVWRGYCSDMTRTVAVGKPAPEMERVYQVVLEAQQAGIAAARAGLAGREIDAAGRTVIQAAGYGEVFSHSFGHSLGLEIHESPNAAPGEERIMPVGAVVSAEPGIYLPGRFGVRIEDVIVLSETGCRDLTKSPKELIVL